MPGFENEADAIMPPNHICIERFLLLRCQDIESTM